MKSLGLTVEPSLFVFVSLRRATANAGLRTGAKSKANRLLSY
jgi:hypothetical protein